ncbi:hypothetical protein P4K96_16555, partial [Bacillus cereus]|nr:hypothetical protein [Bacillus cereus]
FSNSLKSAAFLAVRTRMMPFCGKLMYFSRNSCFDPAFYGEIPAPAQEFYPPKTAGPTSDVSRCEG